MDVSSNQKIFLHPEILTKDYLPDTLLFREEEMETIIRKIAWLLDGSIGINVWITGSKGVGKSHATKILKRDFNTVAEKEGYPARAVYVSARGKTIREVWQDILNETFKVLGIQRTIKYGTSSELRDVFIETLNKSPLKGLLLIADDVDKLKPAYTKSRSLKNQDEFMFVITRLHEDGLKKNFNSIVITRSASFKNLLSAPTRSTFLHHPIYFREYRKEEVEEILRDRAEKAFAPKTVDDSAISYLAEIVTVPIWKGLDLGFYILRKAGEVADKKGIKRIDQTLIQEVVNDGRKDMIRDTVASLEDRELVTLAAALLTAKNEGYEWCTYVSDVVPALLVISKLLGTERFRYRGSYIQKYPLVVLEDVDLIRVYKPFHGGNGRSTMIVFNEDIILLKEVVAEELAQRFNVNANDIVGLLGN